MSYASDNDGSAFITKAEFDSLKNTFQSQLDAYNSGIDNKIDAAISEYLAGVVITTSGPCKLQLPVLEYPLTIIGKNDAAMTDAVSNGLYYRPKEIYDTYHQLGNNNNLNFQQYNSHFEFPEAINANLATTGLEMYNGTFGYGFRPGYAGYELVLNEKWSDVHNTLKYNAHFGVVRAWGNGGRGAAFSFDEKPDATLGGYANGVVRGIQPNYTVYWKTGDPYDWSHTGIWMSYNTTSNAYTNFYNIDKWSISASTNGYGRYQPWDHTDGWSSVSSEITAAKKSGLNKIWNYHTLYVPVLYDGNIAYVNYQDWRYFTKLHTNATAKSACNYQHYMTYLYGHANYSIYDYTNSADGSAWMSPAHAAVSMGWGIGVEGKTPGDSSLTRDWYKFSLVTAVHTLLKYTDNIDNSTKYQLMGYGLPLWHAVTKCNCELTLDVNFTGSAPTLFISKSNEMAGDSIGSWIDAAYLYQISTDNVTFSNTATLVNGKNTIYIKNVNANDTMFFKIVHGRDEMVLNTAPQMTYKEIS